MRFEQSFVVQAPPERVWEFLTDPVRVASALPGAQVTERIDDKTFAGTMTVKVGPVKTTYRGKATFARLEPSSYTAEITGSAQDVKGRGGADMTMSSQLAARDGGTEVSVVSEVTVTGILAQFGRGLIQDVSDQLFKKFTERARAELEQAAAGAHAPQAGEREPGAPEARGSEEGGRERSRPEGGAGAGGAAPPGGPDHPAEAPALDAVSLGGAVAAQVLRRWARRPVFWVAILIAAGLIYALLS